MARRDAAGNAEADDALDQRAAPRISLMLRAAKLICGRAEFLCILRDISVTGIKARLFHPLPPGPDYAIELGNGERLAVEPVWERDGHAGFRFVAGTAPIHALLDEPSEFPKRQIRLRIDLPVSLLARGVVHPATMLDLSQHGAKLECAVPLALRQPVQIEAPGLPPLAGRIRWRRGTVHGVVFHTGFRLDELACLAGRLGLCPRPELRPAVNH